jgi:hypothetical protein
MSKNVGVSPVQRLLFPIFLLPEGRIILKLMSSCSHSRMKEKRMVSSGMLRLVALVRTDVTEELSASFVKVTRIGELGTTLAVTSNRRALRRNTKPTCIKRAPHRTVPEGRGPRLSRELKADLRYGPGCLSPHKWFSDLKTLPPHSPPYHRSRCPGPDST